MECITLASKVSAGASTDGGADCSKAAAQFKEALQAQPEGGDFYVDRPASSMAGNPLLNVMQSFQSMDLKAPAMKHAEASDRQDHGGGADDEQLSQAEQFWAFGEDLITVQSEILRTTLMMETMSTAKQGVTTLFQQQG